jgi:ornithine decarboxylase
MPATSAEAARIAETAGVTLAVLNVGGGFPARYLASDVPPLEDYFRAIAASADEAFGPDRPALECEPGRGLVAPAISLLTRVKLVKGARREVYINDGIYGALMEVNQMPCLLPRYRVIRDGATVTGPTAPFVLYGPTCDPIDRFPVALELPVDIAEDDYIEFDTLGAYGAGSATATRFNGYHSRETVPVGPARSSTAFLRGADAYASCGAQTTGRHGNRRHHQESSSQGSFHV